MKTFIAYPFTEEQLDRFRQEDTQIVFYKDPYTDDDLADVDSIVAFQPFKKHTLQEFPRLQFLQLMSAGINQVDTDALKERGITLANAKGIYSIPIAEWVLMRLLEVNKRAFSHRDMQRDKIWEQDLGMPELTGSRIGIAGTGSIGTEIARKLLAFDVEVIGFNTDGRTTDHVEISYPLSTLAEHLQELDALVLATPETPATKGIINRALLQKAPDDLVLINIGRGSAVDEEALIDYLQENPKATAILDVFQTEPLPQKSPLWNMEQVIVSPHVCASSDRATDRLAKLAIDNLRNWKEQKPVINEIDLDRGY